MDASDVTDLEDSIGTDDKLSIKSNSIMTSTQKDIKRLLNADKPPSRVSNSGSVSRKKKHVKKHLDYTNQNDLEEFQNNLTVRRRGKKKVKKLRRKNKINESEVVIQSDLELQGSELNNELIENSQFKTGYFDLYKHRKKWTNRELKSENDNIQFRNLEIKKRESSQYLFDISEIDLKNMDSQNSNFFEKSNEPNEKRQLVDSQTIKEYKVYKQSNIKKDYLWSRGPDSQVPTNVELADSIYLPYDKG